MMKPGLAARLTLAGLLLLGPTGCVTGACADAIEHADACGVEDIELEDDATGCGEVWECRSDCVVEADCEEIERTVVAHDRNTSLQACLDTCGI